MNACITSCFIILMAFPISSFIFEKTRYDNNKTLNLSTCNELYSSTPSETHLSETMFKRVYLLYYSIVDHLGLSFGCTKTYVNNTMITSPSFVVNGKSINIEARDAGDHVIFFGVYIIVDDEFIEIGLPLMSFIFLNKYDYPIMMKLHDGNYLYTTIISSKMNIEIFLTIGESYPIEVLNENGTRISFGYITTTSRSNIFYLGSGNESFEYIVIPSGGETWEAGSTHSIEFSNIGQILNVDIYLNGWTDENVNLTMLIAKNITNTGLYSWKIPSGLPTGVYVIIIEDSTNNNMSVTSYSFTINASRKEYENGFIIGLVGSTLIFNVVMFIVVGNVNKYAKKT
jgi:hypothetical protein